MKNTLLSALGLIAVAMVVFATEPADAQTTSTGPYYATPAWDQKLQCDTLATCPRFVLLSNWNNAAVLDRETGLVWEQSVDTTFRNFHDSQVFCNNRATGGRRGWRLPTIQELSSLTDPTRNFPSLPAGHPFGGLAFPQPGAWSASISIAAPAFAPSSTSNAWFIEFQHGLADIDVQSDSFGATWCVRGGQGVDPQ